MMSLSLLCAVVVWWGIFDLGTPVRLALAKYVFKVFIAAFDTPFIYWARNWDVPGALEDKSTR